MATYAPPSAYASGRRLSSHWNGLGRTRGVSPIDADLRGFPLRRWPFPAGRWPSNWTRVRPRCRSRHSRAETDRRDPRPRKLGRPARRDNRRDGRHQHCVIDLPHDPRTAPKDVERSSAWGRPKRSPQESSTRVSDLLSGQHDAERSVWPLGSAPLRFADCA